MTEALHQSLVGLRFTVLGGQLMKPLTEQRVERFVLGLCERTGSLNEMFFGT